MRVKMKELTLQATLENLEQVLDFIHDNLEKNGCKRKVQIQISIAVEEIYVNIAHYAYNPQVGPVTIQVRVGGTPSQLIIRFLDCGVPYNPLDTQKPDIELSANDRQIGGLGILMVKKSMDEVGYEYLDGKNILTLKKNILT